MSRALVALTALLAGCSLINPYDFDTPPGPIGDAGADAGALGSDAGADAGVPDAGPLACSPSCPAEEVCVGGLCRGARQLGGGDEFACALVDGATGGEIFCWGRATRCETGTCEAAALEPRRVFVDGTPVAFDAGPTSACAVLDDGRVQCWGSTASGRLGSDRVTGSGAGPALVDGVSDALDVSVGGGHACAVTTRGLFCWGRNDHLQAGGPDSMDIVAAGAVALPEDEDVLGVAAGGDFTCALTAAEVRCWGNAASLRLGEDLSGSASADGAVAVPGLPMPSALVAGDRHACAVTGDGVWCWGANDRGQAGGTPSAEAVARRVLPDTPENPEYVGLAAGASHTCALEAGGTLRCWGDNQHGQLGRPTLDTRDASPRPVDAAAGAVVLGVGARSSCAVFGGELRCWGDDRFGQLGARAALSTVPRRVTGLEAIAQLEHGDAHACAWATDGQVRCFGRGERGQLGDDQRESSSSPVLAIPGALRVAVGVEHACVLRADGAVACWGAGADLKLGTGTDGDAGSPVPFDLRALGVEESVQGLALGRSHTNLLTARNDETAVSTRGVGANSSAQLAVPSELERADRLTPASALPGSNSALTTQLAAGDDFACARVGEGVWCWGDSTHGQAGAVTGLVVDPRVVLGANALDLSARGASVCARVEERVLCWGRNAGGMFAVAGASFDSPTDTPVPADTGAGPDRLIDVALGRDHMCILTEDGVAHCRGRNDRGQLGDGTTTSRAGLEPVASSARFSALALGDGVSCAIEDPGGAVWCWGDDAHGRAGSGRPLRSLDPVLVAF